VTGQRGRHAEVLSQHLVWYVLEPISDQEGVVLVEVAVVEDQEKLGTIRIKALDRMRNARGEKPQITPAHIVDKISALRVYRGDACLFIEHVGPLSGLVAMEFARSAGVETHVHAGDILGNAELARSPDATSPPIPAACGSR